MQAHYHTWKLEAKEKKYMSQWNKESQEESAPTTNELTTNHARQKWAMKNTYNKQKVIAENNNNKQFFSC